MIAMHHRHHGHARVLFMQMHRDDGHRHPMRSHLVLGGGLIAFGLAWMLQDWGVIGSEGLWLVVPAVFAWSGVVRLALDRSPPSVVRALVRLALAAYMFVVIEQIGGLTWSTTWPVLAIGAGVTTISEALFARAWLHAARPEDEEASC